MQRVEKFPVKLCIGLVVMSGVVFGLDRLGWARPIKMVLEVPVAPIRRGLADIVAPLRQGFVGPRRVADLERQVAELTVDAAKATALQQENEALRKIIGAELKPQVNLQPFRVVGRGDKWLIAGGKRDGITEGKVVITEEGVLAGVVKHVDEFVSQVQVVTDPGSEIPAQTQGGSVGVLRGVVLEEVLQADALEIGMRVVTRDLGIVVGVIEEIRQIPAEVYKSAIVKPLYSPRSKYLFVVN